MPSGPSRLAAVTWTGALGAVVVALLGSLLLAAGAATAQAPPTTDPAEACKRVTPSVVFIGTATSISGDTVSFGVTRVVSGQGSAGTDVDVEYPNQFNARRLAEGTSYRVAATTSREQLQSVVPTAAETACGQSTRLANGTMIDTGVLVGVKDKGRALLTKVAVGLVVSLVLLILLGRFLDRRSRYGLHT